MIYGVRIGKAKRVSPVLNPESPGPGQYKIPQRIVAEAPKVHMGSKYKPRDTSDSPGPGHYSPIREKALVRTPSAL